MKQITSLYSVAKGAPLLCVTTEEEILLTGIASTICKISLCIVEHLQDCCVDRLLSVNLWSGVASETLCERNISVKVCQHTPVDGIQDLSHTKKIALRCINTTLRTLLNHLIDIVEV